jgi:dipeptidyl aminopeptidase/acylaminoacyl peptidase
MIRRMLSLALLASAFRLGAAVPEIPVSTFFGSNYVRAATLSPDGTKVAFLAPKGDTYGIAILDLVTQKLTIPFHPEGDSVETVAWKGNDHLIFTGIINGVEGAPLVAITNLEGSRVFSLMPAAKDTEDFSILSGSIESMLKNDPDNILAVGYTTSTELNDSESGGSGQPMLLKIGIKHGDRTKVCSAVDPDPDATLDNFGIDHAGVVRTADRYKGLSEELLYRDNNDSPWQVIHKNSADTVEWQVLGFTGDNKGVYVVDQQSNDLGALRVYDPVTNSLGPVIFTPPGGEIENLLFSPDTKRLIGLIYNDDRRHEVWFEKKYQDIYRKMENTFQGYEVFFSGISDDESKILIRTHSDRDLGAYYLLDLAKGKLGVITTTGPRIDPRTMAAETPVAFTARDGLTVHGYLTLPVGFQKGHPVPLVVHPHGGPYGVRDDWGFDPEVQFMANRGYAVIQVNYRGSGGYGMSFLRKGFHEWGRTMQDDLTDAVKWCIDQGYADPARVGIVGASYGGYATLAGLTFTPELYKCGVNYVGVSDLNELVRIKYGTGNAGSNAFYKLQIGDDPKRLADQSPVNFVDRIRVPLLNAYGENDRRVAINQWTELQAQLDKYHKTYEYMVAKGEGHGFRHPKDAVDFYTKVDDFLKRNL